MGARLKLSTPYLLSLCAQNSDEDFRQSLLGKQPAAEALHISAYFMDVETKLRNLCDASIVKKNNYFNILLLTTVLAITYI